jgi:hypothetical protein
MICIVLVHEDDFVLVEEDTELDWIQELTIGWFEVKVRGRIGPDAGNEKEMIILGKRTRWTD